MIPLEELRAVAAQKDFEVIETRRQTSEGVFYKLLVVTDRGRVFEAEVPEGPDGPAAAWRTLVHRFIDWMAEDGVATHRRPRRLTKALLSQKGV